MLSSIFNDKAEDQKRFDYDHSIKGDIELVGRMITSNFIVNKSTHYTKKKEKRYKHLLEFLHLLHVMAELDTQLARIDDFLGRIAETNAVIKNGFELLKVDDIDGMRGLLLAQNQNVHAFDDDEIREATQEFMIDKIYEQQELQNALNLALNQFGDRIDGLDHSSEEYQNYKAELDGRRAELQKVAAQQNLNYDEAEKYIRVISNDAFDILKNENNQDRYEIYSSNDINDGGLSEQLEEDKANDPLQKKTKLLFSEYNGMGLN